MSFAAPSYLPWLLLAPAALVLAALLRARWRRAAARWVDPVLWPRLMPHHRPARVVLGISALGLAVAGLVVALARPQAGAADEAVAVTGGDVVFALDSSLSMAAGDVAPSRFALAKLTLRRLLEELPDQRVALVQWEAEAQVLSPLTTDRGLVRVLADGIHPASLDRPGSDLGVALDTALDLLGDGGSIVLLTDGEDHGGSLGTGLDSRLAALTAAGVHVEAIGVGTPEGSRIVLDGGRLKRDDRGQPVVTRLDQEALEALARRTGGLYLHLVRADQDLGVLLGRLRMPAAGAGVGRQPVERFAWPLALAVAALAAHLLLLGGGGTGRRWRWRGSAALLVALVSTGAGEVPGPPEAAAPWVRTHWWQTDRALSDLTTRAWADGDTASALALAEAGHRRHPQEPTLAYNLGSLLLEAPAAEGAEPAVAASEAALETALETVPSSASSPSLAADAWYNLGLARVARGETDKALEAFTNALRADPEHDDARHNLEWLLRLPPPQAPPPEPPPPESSPPVPEPPPPSSGSPQPRPGESQPEDSETDEAPPPRLEPERIRELLRSVEDLERRHQDRPSKPAERSTGPKDW